MPSPLRAGQVPHDHIKLDLFAPASGGFASPSVCATCFPHGMRAMPSLRSRPQASGRTSAAAAGSCEYPVLRPLSSFPTLDRRAFAERSGTGTQAVDHGVRIPRLEARLRGARSVDHDQAGEPPRTQEKQPPVAFPFLAEPNDTLALPSGGNRHSKAFVTWTGAFAVKNQDPRRSCGAIWVRRRSALRRTLLYRKA